MTKSLERQKYLVTSFLAYKPGGDGDARGGCNAG